MAEAIDRNNRIERVEKFKPATEAERDMLCGIFKVNRPDLVTLTPERTRSHTDAVNQLREIFSDDTTGSVKGKLFEEGFTIREDGNGTYAVNFKEHIIINLTEEGFNLERLKRKSHKSQTDRQSVHKNIGHKTGGHIRLRDAGGGSQSEKREWEVGQKGNYDDIDDGRTLKR